MQRSFSEMLARDSRVQQWFMAWWGMYVMICLFLMYLVQRYFVHHEFREELLKEHVHRQRWYECDLQQTADSTYKTFTYLYYIFTVGKLAFLPFILYFPVTTAEQVHYVFASLAFGFAIACCVALFIRRMLLIAVLKQIKTYRAIIALNVIELAGQFIMGGLFVGEGSGVYEFLLAMLIVIDTLFQIVDFAVDKDPYGHYGLPEGHHEIKTKPL